MRARPGWNFDNSYVEQQLAVRAKQQLALAWEHSTTLDLYCNMQVPALGQCMGGRHARQASMPESVNVSALVYVGCRLLRPTPALVPLCGGWGHFSV